MRLKRVYFLSVLSWIVRPRPMIFRYILIIFNYPETMQRISTFKETYLKIKKDLSIHPRIFFESIVDKSPVNLYTKKINSIDLLNFFNNIVKVKNNNILTDNNIILETPEEVNFNKPVLKLFLNASFGEQIQKQKILEKLNKNWKYYKSYKDSKKAEDIPFYVFKFDFKSDKIWNVFSYLDPEAAKNIGKEKIINNFKPYENDNGLISNLNNCIIMLINEYDSNLTTIAHELTHYFQIIIGVNVEDENKSNDCGISELQLSKENLNYLFNKNELIPHILINVIHDLKLFHKHYFKHLSKNQFIKLLINEIELNKNKILFSNFGNQFYKFSIKHLNSNLTSIQLLAASCYLEYKWKNIKNYLIDEFI